MDTLSMIWEMLCNAEPLTILSMTIVSLTGGYAVTRRTYPGQRMKRYALCAAAVPAVWLCLLAVHKALMDSLYAPEWGTWILDGVLLIAAIWWIIRYHIGDEKKATPPTPDLMEAPKELLRKKTDNGKAASENESDL